MMSFQWCAKFVLSKFDSNINYTINFPQANRDSFVLINIVVRCATFLRNGNLEVM